MYVLGIDLETTSLDTAEAEIIEIGAVLWDTDRKTPVAMLSEIVIPHGEVSEETIEITGITMEDIAEHGKPLGEVLERLELLRAKAKAWVGHNAIRFDLPILERFYEAANSLPWIDTTEDIPYPKEITMHNLTYLAAAHGFLNPFAHRAVFDVLTMLRVFSCYHPPRKTPSFRAGI
jgi:DNA polymerase-3 subunit epsilon